MDQVNINHRLKKRIEVIEKFRELCIEEISEISSTLISVFSNGNKLLICGNGGSAADSQHLAAEFVSSFARGLRRRSLPAISLTVDTSIITAISNDFGYERVFSRQIEGLASEGDAVLLISTSGKSKSCLTWVLMSQGQNLY